MPMHPTRTSSAPARSAPLWLTAAALLCLPLPAPAQEKLLPAAIGGGLGLAGGGFVSVAIVTAQARRDNYLFAARDALGWESVPVLVGGGVGVVLGFTDPDRLRRSVIGGLLGGFAGIGVGMSLGIAHWDPPEGRWAGGVIGGAAGLLLGVAAGAALPGGDRDGDEDAGFPLTVRIPF